METDEIDRLQVLFLFLSGLKVGKGSVCLPMPFKVRLHIHTHDPNWGWLSLLEEKSRGSERSCLFFYVPVCSFISGHCYCSWEFTWKTSEMRSLVLPETAYCLVSILLCQPPQRTCCLSTVCCNSQSLQLLISLFTKTLVPCCSSSKIFQSEQWKLIKLYTQWTFVNLFYEESLILL